MQTNNPVVELSGQRANHRKFLKQRCIMGGSSDFCAQVGTSLMGDPMLPVAEIITAGYVIDQAVISHVCL